MKRYQIVKGDEVIGETDLEMHDPGMNVYSGRFYPSRGYDNVRSIFKLFSTALDLVGVEREGMAAKYYRKRDALGLILRTRNGRYLATSTIHIVDFDETMDELQVEVAANEVIDDSA
jgi:hypothetical protein